MQRCGQLPGLNVCNVTESLLLDMDHCLLCNNETHWTPVRSTVCFEKEVEYLNWKDGCTTLLLTLSLPRILFVLAIGITSTRNLITPVVKSPVGNPLSFPQLCQHSLFHWRTTRLHVSKLAETFGMSFTLHLLHFDEVPEDFASL